MDVKQIETEARAELAKELAASVKTKIVAQLRKIDQARRILANEELALEVLKRDLGSDTI